MKVQELIEIIQARVISDEQLSTMLVVSGINSAIDTINTIIEPLDSYFEIVFDNAIIPEEDDTIPEDDERIPEESGRFKASYDYNAANKRLTITDTRVAGINGIYRDGLKQRVRDVEMVRQGVYSGNTVAIEGNDIFFLTDITLSSTCTYQINCKLNYQHIDASTTNYTVQDYLNDVIYNLAVWELSNDKDQKAKAKELIGLELERVGLKNNIWSKR